MARITSFLGPLATLLGRELGQTARVAGNHFLLFALLLFALSPHSGVFLLLLVGLVIFVQFSMDPLRRLPEERLLLLPFTAAERVRIRILGFGLSPMPWVILGLPIWGGRRYLGASGALLLLALMSNAMSLLWSRNTGPIRRFGLLRKLPTLPGALGALVTKNLREMLHVLDAYVGLGLALAATAYRIASAKPDPDAVQGLTLLVVLSMSSMAQRLFAFDSKEGFDRYALLPMAGWQVLLAKDAAFLGILSLLVLPLAPLSGWAAGLVLLTFGHGPSVLDPQRQTPWTFVVGARGWSGWIQVLAMFAVGMATFKWSAWILLPCLAGYLGSLFCFGAQLEARWRGKRKGLFSHG